MKRSYKKLLFFAVVFVLLFIYSRTFTENTAVKTEKKYYKSGLGQIQNWVFAPVGEGEVTITWNLYEQGGITHNEKDSYSITYYFDKDGNYTVLSDTKKR